VSTISTAAGAAWPLAWSAYAALSARDEWASLGLGAPDDAAGCFFIAAAAGLAASALDSSPQQFVRAGACAALCGAALIDARTGFLPDRIILPASAVAMAVAAATGYWQAAALGVLALGAPMAALVLTSRGRLLGWGDVKALALIGASLGPERGVLSLAAACLGGASLAFVRFAFRKCSRRAVPFGPYLAAGVLVGLAPSDAFLRGAGVLA
jgi:leader peptidase (prepilin peptidase) / N-methyltransferase